MIAIFYLLSLCSLKQDILQAWLNISYLYRDMRELKTSKISNNFIKYKILNRVVSNFYLISEILGIISYICSKNISVLLRCHTEKYLILKYARYLS